MRETRKSFYYPAPSIPDLLNRQSHILFGDVKAETKYLPLLINVVLNHLKNEIGTKKITADSVIYSFFELDNQEMFKTKWKDLLPQIPELKVRKK